MAFQGRRTIGVRELKAHASEVLRAVQEDCTEVIVTVHGRPVARLEPMPNPETGATVNGMGNSRGVLAALPELTWEDFEAAKQLLAARQLEND